MRYGHHLANHDEWPWLPTQERGDLAPHAWCEICGEVEGRGGRKGLDRGGLVNLLADLKRLLDREGLTMTEAQRRLILKRLEAREVDDPFGFTRERQLTIVAEVASTYLGIHPEAMISYLREC